MSAASQTTQRRRGRPRKAPAVVNPQFPGTVIAMASKPRLRPGVICEVRGCIVCHANNGRRVLILNEEPNGHFYCEGLEGLLATISKEGDLNDRLETRAIFAPDLLYRIGHLP
jgi:hypothetical protein